MKSRTEVKRMITSNSMEVLEYLEKLIEGKEDEGMINTLIMMRSDLVDIERTHQRNLSDYDEYRRGLNKVNLNILKVIDDLPDQYFNEQVEPEPQQVTTTIVSSQLRLQVANLVKDLLDISIQENQPNNNAYIGGFLNHKRHVILSQIIRLVEENKLSIAGTEYLAIANAYNSILDTTKAEQYFKRGIENIDEYADSAFSKIFIIRSYADFLYRNNRHSDGAKQYESAVLEGQGDMDSVINGYTYQMKFVNECDVMNYDEALKAYKKAKEYILNIQNKIVQRYNIDALEHAWNNKQLPPVYSRP